MLSTIMGDATVTSTADMRLDTRRPLLALRQITKRYGNFTALGDVDFACAAGTIHAVLGGNGAGKSTLMKIIAGAVQPTEGTILWNGDEIKLVSPHAATRAGVACVFQELSLVPDLSVADNICLGSAPTKLGLISRADQTREAERLLAVIGAEGIDTRVRIRDLSLSQRQIVEIAKALGKQPRLLIMDEATSALTAADVDRVFVLLRRLREEGTAVLYISHRMHEIEALADTCSVFAGGRHVATFAAGTKTDGEVVELMLGRHVGHLFPDRPTKEREVGKEALAAEELSWEPNLKGVSFVLSAGEIVGVGGLDGQGQRELLLALFGALRRVGGSIRVEGLPVTISSPKEARSPMLRMALIPEDRKTEGLVQPLSIARNLSLAALGRFSRFSLIDRAAEDAGVRQTVASLQIKSDDLRRPVSSLSGGNQQKVVLGKWLLTKPRIILLNDPTRGVDVGTKEEMYRLLRRLADEGAAVLLYTTDHEELIGLCDRVLVMYGGRVVRTLDGDMINEREIVRAAFNLAQGSTSEEHAA